MKGRLAEEGSRVTGFPLQEDLYERILAGEERDPRQILEYFAGRLRRSLDLSVGQFQEDIESGISNAPDLLLQGRAKSRFEVLGLLGIPMISVEFVQDQQRLQSATNTAEIIPALRSLYEKLCDAFPAPSAQDQCVMVLVLEDAEILDITQKLHEVITMLEGNSNDE